MVQLTTHSSATFGQLVQRTLAELNIANRDEMRCQISVNWEEKFTSHKSGPFAVSLFACSYRILSEAEVPFSLSFTLCFSVALYFWLSLSLAGTLIITPLQ